MKKKKLNPIVRKVWHETDSLLEKGKPKSSDVNEFASNVCILIEAQLIHSIVVDK